MGGVDCEEGVEIKTLYNRVSASTTTLCAPKRQVVTGRSTTTDIIQHTPGRFSCRFFIAAAVTVSFVCELNINDTSVWSLWSCGERLLSAKLSQPMVSTAAGQRARISCVSLYTSSQLAGGLAVLVEVMRLAGTRWEVFMVVGVLGLRDDILVAVGFLTVEGVGGIERFRFPGAVRATSSSSSKSESEGAEERDESESDTSGSTRDSPSVRASTLMLGRASLSPLALPSVATAGRALDRVVRWRESASTRRSVSRDILDVRMSWMRYGYNLGVQTYD